MQKRCRFVLKKEFTFCRKHFRLMFMWSLWCVPNNLLDMWWQDKWLQSLVHKGKKEIYHFYKPPWMWISVRVDSVCIVSSALVLFLVQETTKNLRQILTSTFPVSWSKHKTHFRILEQSFRLHFVGKLLCFFFFFLSLRCFYFFYYHFTNTPGNQSHCLDLMAWPVTDTYTKNVQWKMVPGKIAKKLTVVFIINIW